MDIEDWLSGLGLERYAAVFRGSDISLDVLADLTDADLREFGVSLGDRKRLLKAARLLREQEHGRVPPDAASEKGREPLSRVLGGNDPHHLPPRIGECRLCRVQAEQPCPLGAVVPGRVPRIPLPVGLSCRLIGP